MRAVSPRLSFAAALAASAVLSAPPAFAQTSAMPAHPATTPAATAPSAPSAPSAPPVTAPAPQPLATAALKTAGGADAGTVTVFQGPMGAILRVDGKGWPAGWHAVHLHAVGTCEGTAFTSAGGHVNHMDHPRPHGLLNDDGGPDLGDLQNVYAAADGSVHADVYLATSGLDAKPEDYMDADGLSFVVHANADDYVSQPIGGAGARIACGVFAPAS
ncbi:N/A [soil metagenome]